MSDEPIAWSVRAVRDGMWVEMPISAEALIADPAGVIPAAMGMATEHLDELASARAGGADLRDDEAAR